MFSVIPIHVDPSYSKFTIGLVAQTVPGVAPGLSPHVPCSRCRCSALEAAPVLARGVLSVPGPLSRPGLRDAVWGSPRSLLHSFLAAQKVVSAVPA